MEEATYASQEQVIAALVYGILFLVLVTIGLILFFHYSRKKIIEKEIEKINFKLAHQKKILQTSINVQERERKRIAQDLHDAISSKLNVVSLTTHVLLDDESMTEGQIESLQHILNITTNTLESSRKIAHDLMPPVLEKFGLKAALEELFDEFTKSQKLKIQFSVDPIENISNTNALHVFRIVQELLNNAIRHGKANEVSFSLVKNLQGFQIHFVDNGIGFDPKTVKQKAGIGLQSIKSRIAILNGTYQLESAPNEGSSFSINIHSHDK